MTAPLFDRQAFARRLAAAVRGRDVSTRRAGEQAGVSAATISRAARGEVLDVESWLRLEAWIDPGHGAALAGEISSKASA